MSNYDNACNCDQAVSLLRLLEEMHEWYNDNKQVFEDNNLSNDLFIEVENVLIKHGLL